MLSTSQSTYVPRSGVPKEKRERLIMGCESLADIEIIACMSDDLTFRNCDFYAQYHTPLEGEHVPSNLTNFSL
jgi:hypothetical protein